MVPAGDVNHWKLSLYADQVGELLAVQRSIATCLDPDSVVQMIADQARHLTSAEMSAVYLYSLDHLKIGAVSGSLGINLLGTVVPLSNSLAGQAVQKGQAILIEDIQRVKIGYSPLMEKIRGRSFLVLPLMSAAGPLGAVLLASRSPDRLGKDDLHLLELIIPSAALALENALWLVRAQRIAVQEERQRMARRLQGVVAQTLFSASLIADILPRLIECNPLEGRSRMEELREIIHKALVEMRGLLQEDL